MQLCSQCVEKIFAIFFFYPSLMMKKNPRPGRHNGACPGRHDLL